MNYFRRLIDSNDPASVKRFTILVALALYTVANVMALLANKEFLNSGILGTFVEFNFYIIAVGIFGLSVEKIGDVLVERAKSAAAAQILTPSPTVTNVENVEGDVKGSQKDVLEDDGDPAVDLKQIKKSLTNSLKGKKEIIG